MKVHITDAAWSDLLEIAQIIQANSPARAETFLAELYESCEQLAHMPKAYPLLQGQEENGIRRRVHGNYLIFFVIDEGNISVIHVMHGARDYEKILLDDV